MVVWYLATTHPLVDCFRKTSCFSISRWWTFAASNIISSVDSASLPEGFLSALCSLRPFFSLPSFVFFPSLSVFLCALRAALASCCAISWKKSSLVLFFFASFPSFSPAF